MPHIRLFVGLLALALAIAVACQAQSAQQPSRDPGLNRRIEVLVRSQFNIPEDYDIALGVRSPSSTAGYDALPVTLTRDGKTTVVNFLVSADGKALARLESFDLVNDPVFAINVSGRPFRGNPNA